MVQGGQSLQPPRPANFLSGIYLKRGAADVGGVPLFEMLLGCTPLLRHFTWQRCQRRMRWQTCCTPFNSETYTRSQVKVAKVAKHCEFRFSRELRSPMLGRLTDFVSRTSKVSKPCPSAQVAYLAHLAHLYLPDSKLKWVTTVLTGAGLTARFQKFRRTQVSKFQGCKASKSQDCGCVGSFGGEAGRFQLYEIACRRKVSSVND
jgi:hypothetical protein